jgi:DNA-binding LacI/PurR family transcriptional regulator
VLPLNTEEWNRKITISDVADALGISKTTVSRAISGKGRIGTETRQRVMDYIEEHNYKPSPLAKGLAQSRTYNIGWIIPGDSTITDLPFFQRCMMGVSEVAATMDYDVLIIMVYDNDISQLERVVHNQKVDGFILGRTLMKDNREAYLKKSKVPFVVIGSSQNPEVIQIDNNHVLACKELTSILVMKGLRSFALIGGDSNHVVNQIRKSGFEQGLLEQDMKPEDAWISMDNETEEDVERSVEEIVRNDIECIVCMDDRICYEVLRKLYRMQVKVPDQIKVASFYNSDILANYQPAVTTLQYDPKELGEVACHTLLNSINGMDVSNKTLLSYEVLLKNSTQ